MKITKKQLRKLISESFIGAPDGTVYTQRTKRVHSEEGEAFGGGAADEMDIPVVYGEDHTKEATPKLYGILTRNRHEIHNFHKKGPYIYKTLMNPDTDPDNKKYFLSLLSKFPPGGVGYRAYRSDGQDQRLTPFTALRQAAFSQP